MDPIVPMTPIVIIFQHSSNDHYSCNGSNDAIVPTLMMFPMVLTISMLLMA